ncbi:MAG: matrixin family metalloprotease [Vicinamibacteraceae bacterium]|nr:matrixin family metalloprotease [Vicinamibacteraceae bacterium]
MTQRGRAVLAAAVLVGAALAVPLEAYLKFGLVLGNDVRVLRQALPVRYFVRDLPVEGVSVADLDTAVSRAFDAWAGVASATVRAERVGLTSASPLEEDGITVIGFALQPDLERTLGATHYTIDITTGRIVEADIFLNSRFDWSVAAGGEPGRFDVESIALHEVGHLFGLGHSALGETERQGSGRRLLAAGSVMFPIAFPPGSLEGRRLRPDDVAGISDLYPGPRFQDETGSVTGRVTRNGRGMFGAHVVAFNLTSGRLVGNFTLSDDGRFAIAGLDPGPTVLRVEPLDDGDVESFLQPVTGIETDFRVTYSPQLVIVPRGGSVDGGVIEVSR